MNDLDKSPGTFGFSRIATAAITNNPPAGTSACGLFARMDTDRNYAVLSGAGEAIDGIVYGNHAANETILLKADGIQTVKLGGSVSAGGYVQAGALGVAVAWDGTSPVGGKAVKGGVSGDVISIVVNTVSVGAIGVTTSQTDGFGGSGTYYVDTEEVTLSTVGATSLSTANLFRANSIILGFTYRFTEAANLITDFIIGKNGGDTDGLVTTNTTFTLGATGVGAGALVGTLNVAAGKLLITTSGTQNTTGKVRVVVYQRALVAPTS